MPTNRRIPSSKTSGTLHPPSQSSLENKASPSLPSITRSGSPSGLSSLFSKPSKWFSRNVSNPRPQLEPRSSLSSVSSQRKVKISGPTDPRPLPSSPSGSKHDADVRSLASMSALDLSSIGRSSTDLYNIPSSPSGGLGDLRSISRKAWSKSADNLSTVSSSKSLSPLNTKLANEETRARIEQYRSGNSPATPHYPFPSITPQSSSFPDSSPLSQPAHSRSISHAPPPILHSRSYQSNALPPTPRRRAFDPDTSKNSLTEQTQGHGPQAAHSGRGTLFNFVQSGSGHSQSKSGSGSNVLTPPTIIEPTEETPMQNAKRASQVVIRSGFINRLQNFTPSAPQLSSSKNWKPYKVVLQGSKMSFYKPPSDRSTAIKQLFPTGLVPRMDETEDIPEEEPKESKEEGKKKRTYWGRRTHPELIVQDGTVCRGSVDALVHEAVFGTTFEEQESSSKSLLENPSWRHFASSVLLGLSGLGDRSKFEFEFCRCADYLVSGASDDDQAVERNRVGWLAKQYFDLHPSPVDEQAWQTLQKVIDPVRSSDKDDSTTAQLSSPMNGEETSPNVDTFSRPQETENIPPLLEVVTSVSSTHSSNTTSPKRSMRLTIHPRVWAALVHDGLSRETLLQLDPRVLAFSLALYHQSLLDSITPSDLARTLLDQSTEHPFTEFFPDENHPHWLTRFIVLQILGQGASLSKEPDSENGNTSILSESLSLQSSRTHIRSDIITKWVKIAEICLSLGDKCSFKAIFESLTSKPIARLEKAWKRVDNQATMLMKNWIFDLKCEPSSDLQRTCSFPGVKAKAGILVSQAVGATNADWNYSPLSDLMHIFASVRSSLSLLSKEPVPLDNESEVVVSRFVEVWQQQPTRIPMGKTLQIDGLLSMSFAAEPRKKGRFSQHYWRRAAGPQGVHALLPLAFVEPLPSVSLIDRAEIYRGKKLSIENGFEVRQRIESLKNGSSPSTHMHSENRASLPGGLTDLPNQDQTGITFPVFGGQILLMVQPKSETPSRPVSTISTGDGINRAPSVRVKTTNPKSPQRQGSRVRRSSMPALSQPPNFSAQDIRVVVQAGTLEALINLLVYGLPKMTVSVTTMADDNGETALRDETFRNLKLDREEFASIWWNVFRSFVTPMVFFELMKKLFLSKPLGRDSILPGDFLTITASRMEIINTMREWIHNGGGIQDALDDLELFNALAAFLSQPPEQISESIIGQNDEVKHSLTVLTNARAELHQSFTLLTRRPQMQAVPLRGHSMKYKGEEISSQPPDITTTPAKILVQNLDAIMSTAFRAVSQEDLFVSCDLFEVQSVDYAGWFLTQDYNPSIEDVDLQTLYSYLQELQPSSLLGEMAGDSLSRLLPPGIRSLIRVFTVVRRWLIYSITDPKISIHVRRARVLNLMDALEICRALTCVPPDDRDKPLMPVHDRPTVRSFVEAVLTSALVSRESRLYTRVWQTISYHRAAPACDTMAALFEKRNWVGTATFKLTVDPAWLLERMLEVISLPDALEPSQQNPLPLVNFDKRRHLCNLIANAASFTNPRGGPDRRERDRADFDRLNTMEQTAANMDIRSIKEEAYREGYFSDASMFSPSHNKRNFRPFSRLVHAQLEKARRDRQHRDRLIQKKRDEERRAAGQQAKQDRKAELNRTGIGSSRINPSDSKQYRSKRSVSASMLFRTAFRPLSVAFSSDSLSQPQDKRTAEELDFSPSQKPALVISLVDAHVAAFINNERSYCFRMDTEDGGHYLFQTITRADLNRWMSDISRAVSSYAQRRLTYMSDKPRPQLSDHIHARPKISPRDPIAVFGVDLEFLVKRELGSDDIPIGVVPHVIEMCLNEIEVRGIDEVGIYRVAGATKEVTSLREALNRGLTSFDPSTDIFAVGDLVKQWLRNLPDPLFPLAYYHQIIDATNTSDLEERLRNVRTIVQSLPRAHYNVLKRLVEHLDRVADFEEKNHMSVDNLATVIGPNLLRAPHDDFALIMSNMGTTHMLFKALVMHYHVIFDETDGEVDNDEDDNANEDIQGGDGEAVVEPFETVLEEDDEDALLTPDPLSPLPGDTANDPWRDVVINS